MALVLSSSVVDLRAQVDTLVADDALITSPEQLVGDIEVLLEQHSRISEVIARRVGAAENVDATGAVTGKRMCSWLAEDQLLAKGAAARLRRLGRHLPKFAAVRAALASGAINDAHADAMLEALTTLSPEVAATVEPMLVEQGRLDSPTGVAETCDKLLEACGYEKASDRRRERRLADRGVDMAETLDGVHSIRGNLDPVVAAKVKAALRKAAEPAGPDDDRSPRQRLHDALGEIADAYLEKLETGTPSFSGAPSTVVVTMTLDQLEARLAEAREQWVTLPTGRITAETARRLACDAQVIPVVLGGRGEVLDIGRASREFNEAIRRAAFIEQDGTCAFRGCHRRCMELHHIVWWTHGGHTSLDNAAWLCAYHHWLVHEGGWTLSRAPDRSFVWTSPTGEVRRRCLQAA